MSEVAEFVPTTIPPQQREHHYSRLPPNFLGKAALAIQLLLISADAAAQEKNIPPPSTLTVADDTPRDINAEPDSLVREWVASEEGKAMKKHLKEAVKKLDDPVFIERQKATVEILNLLEKLQDILYPFPEDFREILGEGLSANALFGEDFRSFMMEQGFSAEQSVALESLRDFQSKTDLNAEPRIMAGSYTASTLLHALKKQTGFDFVFENEIPFVTVDIERNENTWSNAIEKLLKRMGGGYIHFDSERSIVSIDHNQHVLEQTVIDGANVYVIKRLPNGRRSIEVTRVPTKGRFMKRVQFWSGCLRTDISHENESQQSAPFFPNALLLMNRINTQGIFTNPITPKTIRAPIASAAQVLHAPFGKKIPLGKWQTVHCTKKKHGDGWIVMIHTKFNEAAGELSGYDPCDYLQGKIMSSNDFCCLNETGALKHVLGKPYSGNRSQQHAMYELTEEPTAVRIRFIPDCQSYLFHPPPELLPTATNP